MSDLIGTERPARQTCDAIHVPGCYNPGLDVTACTCGDIWWRGPVGTWHSRPIRERETVNDHHGGTYVHLGRTIAWDVYFLHAKGCTNRRAVPSRRHVCGGAVGGDYAAAVKAVS